MSTPIQEKGDNSFPPFHERRSSDEDGTTLDEVDNNNSRPNHLRLTASYADGPDHINRERSKSPLTPHQQREQSQQLQDELEMLKAERVASQAEESYESGLGRERSTMGRSRSRNEPNMEPADDFDIDTTPIHEKTKIYQPPKNPSTKLAKFFKRVHNSSFLVRYFVYITPLTALLLIPVLFGLYLFPTANVGGVKLFWFGIWLEIVWLTLWAGRVRIESDSRCSN